MLIETGAIGDICVYRIKTRHLGSEIGRHLSSGTLAPRTGPGHAVLIDLAEVRRIDHGGMAVLLTLHQALPDIAFASASKAVMERLRNIGLDRVLRLFDTVAQAAASDWARRHLLAGRRAVLLSAGKGTRCAPLTRDLPKPMLDVLGKPVLERLMDHLSGFGINDFILNPGHLGPVIHNHFGDGHRLGHRVSYLNEGRHGPDGWDAAPIGSASSLARLAHQHCAFERDTFVLCGDALIDLDAAAMMDTHRRSGAMATIAVQTVAERNVSKYGIVVGDAEGRMTSFQEKPPVGQARSRLANTGIYIFSPEALALLPDRNDQDIAHDLLPAILRAGGRIQVHADPFNWTDIGCARDYYAAIAAALESRIDAAAIGEQSREGLWLGDGAHVSHRARISGPVYVAPGAEIAAGAEVIGPAMIGRDCEIEPRSLVKRSLIMPGTRLHKGALAVDSIASSDWAVSHPLADGRALSNPPLDLVSSVTTAIARTKPTRVVPLSLRAAG